MRSTLPLLTLMSSLALLGCDTEPPSIDTGVEPVEQELALELVDSGFVAPITVVADPDGRRFVVDQIGVIREIGSDTDWLDLRDRMVELNPGFDERGLLDMAFDPGFEENGWVYVYYSAPLREGAPDGWDHTGHLSRFTVGSDGLPDMGSEVVLLAVDEPQFNHNGGALAFGPDDGMLYLSLGDGGAANDVGLGHPPLGNGQDTTTLLGSILRLDVSSGEVEIPADNPFADGVDGRPEIWAWGFRNPFRMSFDPPSGRLVVGDVGQDLFEEIDLVEGGRNYGWNIMEGFHCFDPDNPTVPPAECADVGPLGEPLQLPVLEYPQPTEEEPDVEVAGIAVLAGFVYRGDALEGLDGQFFFGDFSQSFEELQGSLFVAEPDRGWAARRIPLEALEGKVVRGLGRDGDGELYLLVSSELGPSGTTGEVHRIVQRPVDEGR